MQHSIGSIISELEEKGHHIRNIYNVRKKNIKKVHCPFEELICNLS